MATLDTKKMLAAAVAAAQDKQALDLRILELDPAESGLTDYFLVMSGSNSRQMQSLADEIELQLKRQFGNLANSREGYRQAEWILLDYVDFVVHIFSEEKRSFYDIERLRKSAHNLTPDDLQAAMVERTGRARKSATKNSGGQEARPEAGTESRPKTRSAGSKQAAGKKTSATRRVGGMPMGKRKSTGASKTSAAKKASGAKASGGKAPSAKAKKSSRPTPTERTGSRTGSRNKATPKSTPKSRKRS